MRLVLVRPRRETWNISTAIQIRPDGHVQTVGADQREERGQEATTIRTKAFHDQVMEFIDSIPMNPAPNNQVNASQETTWLLLFLYMAIAPCRR